MRNNISTGGIQLLPISILKPTTYRIHCVDVVHFRVEKVSLLYVNFSVIKFLKLTPSFRNFLSYYRPHRSKETNDVLEYLFQIFAL
jgi:hypothetical protein